MKTNDDIIDELVEAKFIQTPHIANVFRAVDRGNYFSSDQRCYAYKDAAIRGEKLYLYPPKIYAEVMEELNLRPGLSFLNMGSGTGYFSTMAGLILGIYGINHGIELYSDMVDFANERLEEFIRTSSAIDECDFCKPSFVVGNCFMLDSSCQQYDRVYCGASCPVEYELYVKNLVKIGGILIMPLDKKFLKIKRTGEFNWDTVNMLSPSFDSLTAPPPCCDSSEHIKLDNICPPKLKDICRSNIRGILREIIVKENPNLKKKERRVEAIVSQRSSESRYGYFCPGLVVLPSRLYFYHEISLKLQDLRKEDRMKRKLHTDRSSQYRAFDPVTSKPKSSFTASEKCSRSGNQNAFPIFKKASKSIHSASHTRFNPHTSAHSSKSDKKIRTSSKRKCPVCDDKGTSSSLLDILKPRRSSPFLWQRISSRNSDSEKKEESESSCAKSNEDDDDTYTRPMVKKIADLPLPKPLLLYLNYGRGRK